MIGLSRPFRCPSVNPWSPEDGRCQLPENHEDDHEGTWGNRAVLWDTSPVTVSDESPDRWEVVDA